MSEADRIIAALALLPHPEGGHYRQTFKDSAGAERARPFDGDLLSAARGRNIGLHRIDAAEVWHFYRGAPLELTIHGRGQRGRMRHVLGPDVEKGERPQIVVPPRAWQGARPLGDYALVGCTVAPGFKFETFELAPPDFRG